MKCTNEEIKELLPMFLEKGLDPGRRFRIERHLEICEDCRIELGLLRMMYEETPPDPGEAFWAWMPEKIHKEVQKRKSPVWKRGRLEAVRIFDRLTLKRWALAAASSVVLAATALLVLRNTPMTAKDHIPPQAADEYIYFEVGSPAAVNISELDKNGLEAVAAWADGELAVVMDKKIEEESFLQMDESRKDAALYDALIELNASEIERLSRMLDRKKQEV